jgi:DinB superfamily
MIRAMNIESNRIADQMASALNGEAWYGDSLREILKDVTAREAQARPLHNAHSIWELVYHVDAWVAFALGAINEDPIPAWPAMPVERDWPPVAETSDAAAWKKTLESFLLRHSQLADAVRLFSDERLSTVVPGRKYNFRRLFYGTIQHAVYHAGQITLLKKMARSAPP